jgi:hypothetical protein
MMLHSTVSTWQRRHHNARRVLRLLPVLVFLLTLMVLAGPAGHSSVEFMHALLQSAAASLASCFVSVAAFGFYSYLMDRSSGL